MDSPKLGDFVDPTVDLVLDEVLGAVLGTTEGLVGPSLYPLLGNDVAR